MRKLDMKKRILMIGLLFGVGSATAQLAGDVDVSWADNGWVVNEHVASKHEHFQDLVMLSDNSFIMVGYTLPNPDILIIKYTSEGELDLTFGENGVIVLDMSLGGEDVAYAAKALENGKILIAGVTQGFNSFDAIVMRLEADGTFDDDFGTVGVVKYSAGEGTYVLPSGIDVLSDNSIVIGATIIADGTYNMGAIRFTQHGALYTLFGTNGLAMLDVPSSTQYVNAMRVLDNGSVFLAGYLISGGTREALIIKFNSSGTLDPTFGNSGVAEPIAFAGLNTQFNDLEVDLEGNIVVVATTGHETATDHESYIFRLTSEGQFDNTFGTSGLINFSSSVYLNKIRRVQDGKMLVSGRVADNLLLEAFVFMFDELGEADCAFHCDGIRTGLPYDITDSDMFGKLLGVMTDGSILVGGDFESPDFDNSTMYLTKLFNTNQVVGLSENGLTNSVINIYPNPTSEHFSVMLNDNEQFVQIQLYSMDGRVVKEWNQESSTYHLDGAVASGRYMLNVQTNLTSHKSNLIINK